ncbi:MAG: two-component system sensor histidine kinase ChvG [Gammaproteobacteria bacterium]|jgi:two-component system sensor histidine kinase ChvG
MTLNKQLFCVSLLLLSLPWAGCQYLQEMDSILRTSQERALTASTEAIAAVFSQQPDLLYPNGQPKIENSHSIKPPNQANHTSLYFYPLQAPAWIDGYAEEWENIPAFQFTNPKLKTKKLRYRTAIHRDKLYFFFEVTDPDIIYNNPSRSRINDGDRIIITTGAGKSYVFTTAAPGDVTARYINAPLGTYRESAISSHWRDTANGYTLEIAVPKKLSGGKISFTVVDQNKETGNGQSFDFYSPFGINPDNSPNNSPDNSHDNKANRLSTAATKTIDEAEPLNTIYQPEALQIKLAIFNQPGQRLKVFDLNAWTLAEQGNILQTEQSSSHWLIKKLYRQLLDAQPNLYPTYQQQTKNTHRQEINAALAGKTATAWYRDPSSNSQYIIASASPIIKQRDGNANSLDKDQIIAVVVTEQSSEKMVALSDNAFNRLLLQGLGAMVLVGLGLLGYASILSWRIRFLSQAANQVMSDDGKWTNSFPQSDAKDEIGELTRNYAKLIERLKDYTEYLQTLSRKLSHELRTPLAIIHSSLDNLDNQPLTEKSTTYQQRAKEGALRLGSILTAMSEASRVEESIENTVRETIQLAPLLTTVIQAYQDIYKHKQILFVDQTNGHIASTTVYAAPDLLVQMLDKLVDNAASFCPDDGNIACILDEQKKSFSIAIANDGPLLPEKMRGQLFDNLVSMRENNNHSHHLGLGLHIVDLIVKYHNGKITAANQDNGKGVIFTIYLPKNHSD